MENLAAVKKVFHKSNCQYFLEFWIDCNYSGALYYIERTSSRHGSSTFVTTQLTEAQYKYKLKDQ